MMMLIGMDTHRVLGDDGDPTSQFAQPKLRDVHLAIIVIIVMNMVVMIMINDV